MRREVVLGLLVAALLIGGTLFNSSAVAAEEVITATLVRPRGVRAAKRARLTLTIEQYATEEDAEEYQKILDEQGSDGLIKTLRQRKRGVARVQGGLTRTINHVRVHEGTGGSRIIIVTEFPLYFPEEDPRDLRSRESLGFIKLDLNKENMGGGTLAEAIGISVTEDGVLQIQAHRTRPIKLEDVRRER